MKIVNDLSGTELFEVSADRFEDITPDMFKKAMAEAGGFYNHKIGCLTVDGKNHLYNNVAVAVRMTYAEYKKNFSECRTQKGSYNAEDKTIVVYRWILR